MTISSPKPAPEAAGAPPPLASALRLLIVEDSEDDAALLLRELRRGGYAVSAERVDTPDAMRTALELRVWDAVTSDHAMPKFSAPAALAMVKNTRPELPFIIVSNEIDLNLAVLLMKAGAQDYIQKREPVRDLRDSILRYQTLAEGTEGQGATFYFTL